MNFHSLRLRMAAWYAGVLALCLVVFGAAVYLGLAGYLERTLRSSLRNDAQRGHAERVHTLLVYS